MSAADAGGCLLKVDQPVGFGVLKGSNQDTMQYGQHGPIEANAKGQGNHEGDTKSRRPTQRTNRIPDEPLHIW